MFASDSISLMPYSYRLFDGPASSAAISLPTK